MLNDHYINLSAAPGFQISSMQQEYSRRVEVSYPGVKIARDVTFEEIWTLFQDSGFLYPEKIARLAPVLPEIKHTVRTLLQENGHLMATVALREEQTLEAHMNILRWYDKTWIVQHLAALPLSARTMSASARLTLGFTFYGRLRPDIVWSKMYFRPNNPWPARVFGGYAKRIDDPATSDLRTFHYLVAPTSAPAPSLTGEIEVRNATAADAALIETWFTARGRSAEVQANQLQASCSALATISQAYDRAGLLRRREALMAERNGRVTGFALLEMASLGMNFSELTNAFTVHLLDETDTETRRTLVEAAKRRYAELGRAQCIALEESDDWSAYEAAGFTKSKEYTCWTFHRDHLAGMEEYFLTLFSARRRRCS